jgi:polysaccharide chain length determinant protein (PEP-CTERM system associated)
MEESRKTIFDQFAIFIHRKWLFIVPLIIGSVAGLAVSFELPEKYSSTTLILVEEQQIPEEYVTPTDKTPFSQRLNVISQQILSRTRLEKIIKEFGLYSQQGPGLVDKAKSLITGSATEAPTPDEIIEHMRADIQFTVIGEQNPKKQQGSGGNAFTITYSGEDPQTTMQVTNTLSSLFIEENLKVREQYAEGTSEFLSSELETAQQELSVLEQKLKDFKQAHMGTLPGQLDANLRTLDRLQLELQTVSAQLKTNEDRKLVLEEQMKYNAPMAISPAVQGTIAAELESARAELGQMLSVYKESYPDVIILRKRIKDLERQVQGEVVEEPAKGPAPPKVMHPAYSELMGVKSQITTLSRREANIRKQIDQYSARVELTPASEQQLADLQRDYDISLQNYQALLEKKMSARLSENLEKRQKGARFRVVDPANVPQSPDQPNKPLVISIGTLAGAAVGIGLVFMVEFLNPAFRKPEDFEGVIDSPVLTSIPLFSLGEAEKK